MRYQRKGLLLLHNEKVVSVFLIIAFFPVRISKHVTWLLIRIFSFFRLQVHHQIISLSVGAIKHANIVALYFGFKKRKPECQHLRLHSLGLICFLVVTVNQSAFCVSL